MDPDLDDSLLRDALTGVYSRAVFDRQLLEEIASAGQLGYPLSLFVLDIDHFKSVNDGFGHARGDTVLAELGCRLRADLRSNDRVYRYGGDEFVVLLPHTPMAQAVEVAQRLLKGISARLFPGEPPVNLSISVGASFFPVDGSTPPEILIAADRRLFQAKRNGRSQVVYQDQLQPDFSGTIQLSRLIERDQALEAIRVFFSQVELQTRSALCLSGPSGSGLTRLLAEGERAAQMNNMAALQVRGTPALGKRMFGALLEASHNFGDLPQPALGAEAYAEALRRACSQPLVSEKPAQAFVILVDDPDDLDPASLEFFQKLYFTESLPHLALVYTHSRSLSVPYFSTLEPQTTLTISALSLDGIQLWLRFYLQWEAPPELIQWLHEQTGGLPTRLQRSLEYLIQTHVLQRIQGKWRCQNGYEHHQLDEILSHPASPPSQLPNNLPLFVGRHVELHALKQVLLHERLLSLVGPGGLGKSRLAIQLAAESLENFPQGVFFVPLAGLQSAEQLLPAVASAVQLRFAGRKEPKQELLQFLQSRRLLLVMDNFEHLRDGADLLLEFLKEAAGVSLLVTSRDPLNLPGERLFEIDGLPFPKTDADGELEIFEAVQFFLQSIRQRLPGFLLPADERQSAAQICRLVEGSPLGLELAAAWVPVIPPHEIAAEIERSLAFLATNHPQGTSRHRSLLAVLDSFWDLLTENEQDLICQLAVFANGFQREAARAVAKVSALFLDALVAKAYLRVDPQGRYQMHEMLRQYAAGKLALKPALQEAACEQHCRFYLEWVSRLEEHLEDDPKTIRMVTRDLDNLHLAWTWAPEHDRIDLLRQSVNSLKIYIEATNRWEEGRQMIAPALQRLEERARTSELSPEDEVFWQQLRQADGCFLIPLGRLEEARTILEDVHARWAQLNHAAGNYGSLMELGEVYQFLGDLAHARRLLEESLRLARAAGDQRGLVNTLILLANIAIDQADLPASLSMLAEGLRISRAIGGRAKTAHVLKLLGICYSELGDLSAAEASYNESLAIYQETGARLGVAEILNNLGTNALNAGQLDEAQRRMEESLFLVRDIGHRYMEAVCLNNLGILANERGDFVTAQMLYEDALKLYRGFGYKRGIVDALDSLGAMAIEQKDYAAAKMRYRENLSLAVEIGYKRLIPYSLVGFACLACEGDYRYQRAVQLCAAAQSIQTRDTVTMDSVQQRFMARTLLKTQAVLPQADFESAWSQGLSLTEAQALILAMECR